MDNIMQMKHLTSKINIALLAIGVALSTGVAAKQEYANDDSLIPVMQTITNYNYSTVKVIPADVVKHRLLLYVNKPIARKGEISVRNRVCSNISKALNDDDSEAKLVIGGISNWDYFVTTCSRKGSSIAIIVSLVTPPNTNPPAKIYDPVDRGVAATK